MRPQESEFLTRLVAERAAWEAERDLGPFDPADLVRWAETYGHPEVWAKKAQQAHNRAENLSAERDRYREALEKIAYPDSREVAILDEASALAREAIDA